MSCDVPVYCTCRVPKKYERGRTSLRYLLREGGIAQVARGALVLPLLQNIPPAALQGPEDGHVKRLENVCRILRQEAKADIILLAERGNKGREVGRQIVPEKHLYILTRQSALYVRQKNLFAGVGFFFLK